MLLSSPYTVTKDKLFSDLQSDGVHVDINLLNRAKGGDSEAFYEIGVLYISKDDKQDKILPWFLLSAERNNPEAQYHIGMMYCYGQNTPIDYLLAMEWYLRAARQDHLRACLEIGYLYRNGYGVTANEYMAFQWFCKSKKISKDNELGLNELIRRSEETVNVERGKRRAFDDLNKLRLKQQEKDELQTLRKAIASFEQELKNREATIKVLEKENQSSHTILFQERRERDKLLNQFEYEKQHILTQSEHQTNEKIQHLTQHNLSLEEKLETKTKQVLQLQNENCTLQNLLKLKRYKYEQQQQQAYQNKYLLQHQYHHVPNNKLHESKSLAEPEQTINNKEKQRLLDEIKTLKASNTQLQQDAKATTEKLVMLENLNQSLRDSNHQMTRLTERLTESNQTCVSLLTQEKQTIFQEAQSLKQVNTDLGLELKSMNEKLSLLENEKLDTTNVIRDAIKAHVTRISEAPQKPNKEEGGGENELKQKDRKFKALENKYQALITLHDQKMFEAQEMMTVMVNQNDAALQSLQEQNEELMNELQAKALIERNLESKNKKIKSLENEIRELKYLKASFEYEASL